MADSIEEAVGRQIIDAVGIDGTNPADRSWNDQAIKWVLGETVILFLGFVKHRQ